MPLVSQCPGDQRFEVQGPCALIGTESLCVRMGEIHVKHQLIHPSQLQEFANLQFGGHFESILQPPALGYLLSGLWCCNISSSIHSQPKAELGVEVTRVEAVV